MSLKFDHAVGQRLGDGEVLRELAGEEDIPIGFDKVRCHLLAHMGDHCRRSERLGVGKALE